MGVKTYNMWGCSVQGILNKFPNTDACVFGGESVIEDAIESAAREVARSLREDMIQALTNVQLEILVDYATDGQSTATLGQRPIKTGTVHLWKFFCGVTDSNYEKFSSFCGDGPPRIGQCEMDTDDFSVNVNTGVVTFSPTLDLNERIYASYDLETESTAFAVGSCCDATTALVLADLSALTANEAGDRTPFHSHWRERAKEIRRQLLSGDFIPAELRDRQFYQEIVRKQNRVISRRRVRGS